MAKPLIPVDVIYEHALALIDAEGAQALNARRLASDLKCSTRTLYQQVGNHEELIRALVGRHFSQLQLDFHEYDTWESTGPCSGVSRCTMRWKRIRSSPN